jgi:hypothetical protein
MLMQKKWKYHKGSSVEPTEAEQNEREELGK